jgi:hypothetical protein
MPSSVHCRRIDSAMSARSSIPRQSGVLIFRTPALKNRARLSIVQLLDLAFARSPALTLLNHPRTTMKLRALISDLRRRVQLLDSDIQEEEKRTGISDPSNSAYPILARNLRTRRGNLLATITMLESRLAETDMAA